jgi:capsular polysaccharide biosynthesis protein
MRDFTFQDLLKLLRKKLWFICLITIISVGASGYLSYFYITPLYANSSTLLVNDRTQSGIPSLNDVLVYEKLIGTYKDIIKSKRILKPIAEQYNMSVDLLSPMVNVTSRTNSQVITVTVTGPNYSEATQLVNIIAERFSSELPEIMTIDNVQILDPADLKLKQSPFKPNKMLNMILAFILGAISSSAIVVILYFLDSHIRTEEELALISDYALLCSIPRYDKKSRMHSSYTRR